MRSRGFSLIDVIIGVALMVLAIVALSQSLIQYIRINNHALAQSRLACTMTNLGSDFSAILRYDGPAAQALRNGVFATSFTVTQWEPDNDQAPVDCQAGVSQANDLLKLNCHDRWGNTATRELPLSISQPAPGSVVAR